MKETYGPQTDIGDYIHAWKYRGKGESFSEYSNRVAAALQDDPIHFKKFRDCLREQRFLPGGRIQSAMGSLRQATAYNCFVMPTIEDNMGSILDVLRVSVETMRRGGGVGYDFSQLRPYGDRIKTLDSIASGPVSFMGIFDAACKTVSSAGHRRGAQMAVLRVDHPDIETFVHAKQNQTALTAFNISVAVTDEFMGAVKEGTKFDLKFEGQKRGEIDARTLWEQIMRSTWDWAEPGVLFIDRINEMNNLYYCEEICATNPCGEQPLPPDGACLLGSFNLVKYITEHGTWGKRAFDWDKFSEDIRICVRAMDNVIDRTLYPTKEQEVEAKMKRRMGLGVTGLANCGESLGFPYGSDRFIEWTRQVFFMLRNMCYTTSADLAEEKGSFPLYSKEDYISGEFIKRLPVWLVNKIERKGIRNSHLVSVAPTGTISLAADNVSSGIEPVFSKRYDRIIQTENGERVVAVEDYGVRVLGTEPVLTSDCTAHHHLNVLAAAQEYVDSAVSKTCNVNPDMPWQEFKDVYMKAWELGCKGITTFNPGGKRFGILKAPDEPDVEEPLACYIDAETGAKSCGD